MIKNAGHAAVGVALILAVGWLLAQPSVHKSMLHHEGAHYAVAGVLAALALFTVASLWRMLKGGSKPAPARTTSYTAPARRR